MTWTCCRCSANSLPRDQDAALQAREAGTPQDRARHQHRRDQPHHRRRAHRGRCRTRAAQSVRSVERHESARGAAHLARLGRAARGPRRPHGAGRVLTGSGARAPSAVSRPMRRRKSAWRISRHWHWTSRCGERRPSALRWLDAPPAATLASARDLLRRLGALDAAGKVTAHGRAMQEFPAHPRLAHMLLKARELGAAPLAAELAALLSDRDLLRAGGGPRERDSDVRTRLEALRRGGAELDRGALDRVRRAQRSFEQQLGSARARRTSRRRRRRRVARRWPIRIGSGAAGRAPRRATSSSNGRGAVFASAESIAREEFIVAVDLDDREREARIRLAAPLDKADLLEHFAAQTASARDELVWDERTEAVVARRVIRLDELLIEEKPLNDVPRAASAAAMLEGVRSLGLDALPWDDDARDFLARCEFVRKLGRKDLADWPDFSREALAQRSRLARALSRRRHAPLAAHARAAARRVACAAELRTAAQARRTRADAHRAAHRLARAHRLPATTTRPSRRCACRKCSVWRPRRASAAARCR